MNESRPAGRLQARRLPAPIARPPIRSLADTVRWGTPAGRRPWSPLRERWRRADWQEANAGHFARSLEAQAGADEAVRRGAVPMVGHLWLARVDATGRQWDLGLVGARVVTTAGVGFIVDAFQGLQTLSTMRYHGLGTGTTAETSSQTALVSELTTAYQVASTRATGSLGELSGSPNVYETTATITVSATVAATEHGIFSQAATGGGVMLDRTVFSVVNLASGESLQAQYDLTFPAGS
jgi:hypothetical protein